MSGREELLALVRREPRFLVITHENPDGDALGSLIAFHDLLQALGKDVVSYLAEKELPLPPEYATLQLADLTHTPPADLSQRVAVALDCGNLDRTPEDLLKGAKALINIDHHHDNTRFGTVNYVDPEASCTAEIVFSLMGDLGFAPTPRVAEALYVAVVTDTGRFMYENTGPAAHRMAAALIEAGVDVQAVYHRLYEDAPVEKVALLARALSKLRRYDNGALTVTFLEQGDFAAVGAKPNYAEGIVDHLRAVRGTKVAALVRAVGGTYKISLRSSDDGIDVSAIARLQGGGGHRRAAGFQSALSGEELISFLRAQLANQLGRDGNQRPLAPQRPGAPV